MAASVEHYVNIFSHQRGGGFDFPVYSGRLMYGDGFDFPVYTGGLQYGDGIGDVLRGIWNWFRPIVRQGAQTLLRTTGDALKEGATVQDVLKAAIRPTVSSVLGATAEQVATRLGDDKPIAAPPPGPAPAIPPPQQGSGHRKRRTLYKHSKPYPKLSFFKTSQSRNF